MAAALLAGMLALAMAPAQAADPATADDTARFLAGMTPAADSPLAALTKSPDWGQHSRIFNTIFEREDANTLSKLREFAKDHLGEPHDTMLYMFSGPDFLYATSFFPHATTYVFAGLEPVGAVPPLTSLSRGSIDLTLGNLERSLSTIMNLSFFITKNMQSQLSVGPVYGTLPVLYVFLARTGKTIHDVSFVSLDQDGNFLPPPSDATAAGARRSALSAAESTAKGVKIVFSDGDGPMQTLYYFSTNLEDGGVKRSGFLAFCDKLGVADSFIKSASYLLHGGGFSKVRSFLLDHSATILEDDSGIPLDYFDPKKWRLQPFGHYLGPIAVFPGEYQPRLAELFRKDAIPIDFGLGYMWHRNESNLLLAQKIATATPEAGVSPALTTGSDTSKATDGAASAAAEAPKPHRKRAITSAKAQPGPGGFLGLFGVGDNYNSQPVPSALARPPR